VNKVKLKLSSSSLIGIITIIIAGLTLLVYWDTKNHQFLNFDDNVYISLNYHIKNGFSLENIKWAFSFVDVAYWHPLTWLSLMLDCEIFGPNPGPLLMMNVAIHILNSILLFMIINKLTGAYIKSTLVALLFALHPVNVESVAWFVERKTVLSTLFLFAAIYTYLFYTQSKKTQLYFVTMFLYILGLMSKPIILTFPFLLLVLDYWPLKRFEKASKDKIEIINIPDKPISKFVSLCKSKGGFLILEKLPFIALSILSVSVSMLSLLKFQTVINYQSVPIYLRIQNLFVSIFQYLRNFIWPVELSIFYPFPHAIPNWQFLLSSFLVLLITWLTWKVRKKRPWLIMGWGWFLIAFSPASGIIQSGMWPAIANRFMYIPLIGIFVMVIWEGDKRLNGQYSQFLKIILCLAMLIYFAALARLQNIHYSNSYALFQRSLETVGDNDLAFTNIGDALVSSGKVDEAMKYFARTIKRNPNHPNAYYNYGICLVMKEDDKQAMPYFIRSIELNPKLINAYLSISQIEQRKGNYDQAINIIKKTLEIDNDDLNIHINYGVILSIQGKLEEAIPHYLFVLKKDPSHLQARINLAQAYDQMGLNSEAISEYKKLDKSIIHHKGYIYYAMAGIYSKKKNFIECETYLKLAIKEKFNIWGYLESDIRYKNFRESVNYSEFLKNNKKKIN
jgi:protein O-mannosyl-transferase